MNVFYESGIMDLVAVTLAVSMMLGPLVPYAMQGVSRRRKK
jgi:hypothetical protein